MNRYHILIARMKLQDWCSLSDYNAGRRDGGQVILTDLERRRYWSGWQPVAVDRWRHTVLWSQSCWLCADDQDDLAKSCTRHRSTSSHTNQSVDWPDRTTSRLWVWVGVSAGSSDHWVTPASHSDTAAAAGGVSASDVQLRVVDGRPGVSE